MLHWAIQFGAEMFQAPEDDKFTVYSRWATDAAKAIKEGRLQDSIDDIIGEFVDKAERYSFDPKGALVMAVLAVLQQASIKHELNGHIQPIKGRKSEIHMDKAENIAIEHIDWLWTGHLALGMLEMISGVPEMGKSQVQCDIAARVTRGRDWPDGTPGCKPSNVLMLAAEDSWQHVVVPRLIAADADMSKIIYIRDIINIKTNLKEGFLLQEHCDILGAAISAEKILLVTIDPITAFMGGKMDAHKATEVRNVLNPLKEVAEREHCCISVLTHPAKNASNKARDQFIGSQAFVALARIAHLVVEEVGTDRKLFLNAKNNVHARMPCWAYRFEQLTVGEHEGQPVIASHVVWDNEPVQITPDAAVEAASGAARAPDRTEAETFLKETLEDGPMKVKEIEKSAKEAGLSWATVKNAKNKLKIIAKKNGMGKDSFWEWSLPKADIIPFRIVPKDDE